MFQLYQIEGPPTPFTRMLSVCFWLVSYNLYGVCVEPTFRVIIMTCLCLVFTLICICHISRGVRIIRWKYSTKKWYVSSCYAFWRMVCNCFDDRLAADHTRLAMPANFCRQHVWHRFRYASNNVFKMASAWHPLAFWFTPYCARHCRLCVCVYVNSSNQAMRTPRIQPLFARVRPT